MDDNYVRILAQPPPPVNWVSCLPTPQWKKSLQRAAAHRLKTCVFWKALVLHGFLEPWVCSQPEGGPGWRANWQVRKPRSVSVTPSVVEHSFLLILGPQVKSSHLYWPKCSKWYHAKSCLNSSDLGAPSTPILATVCLHQPVMFGFYFSQCFSCSSHRMEILHRISPDYLILRQH